MIQKGYLVVADVSGYTAFITQTELEHAREILDTLLKTLVEQFRPPLIVSKLEGDAVLAYTPEASFLQGQTLLEAIERIYFTFRHTRDSIHRACRCQACTLVSTLDLKFVLHYGQFTLQTIGTIKDLQGADVIVVHRLLKNNVVKTTGVTAYAFFTEASAQAIPLGDLTQSMIPHSETYEHLGEVKGYVHNLAQVWEHDRERRQIFISPQQAWLTVEFDLPVPPSLAWDYLNNPQCICEWCGLASVKPTDLKLGRLGVGSGRYCVHAKGKETTVETILDYQLFDYVTVQASLSNGIVMRTTTRITPTDQGSRVAWYASQPNGRGALRTLVARVLLPIMKREMHRELRMGEDKLRKMVDADLVAGKIVANAESRQSEAQQA